MSERGQVAGEAYEPDPRRRRLRVVAQLIDKPLFMALVALSFAAAARGPGLLIEGYRPSGWFVLGLWICLSVASRLLVLGMLGRFRALFDIAPPGAERAAPQGAGKEE